MTDEGLVFVEDDAVSDARTFKVEPLFVRRWLGAVRFNRTLLAGSSGLVETTYQKLVLRPQQGVRAIATYHHRCH